MQPPGCQEARHPVRRRGKDMSLTRRQFTAAALSTSAAALAGCATAPERPQGSFPLEWPRIPAPAAWAAQVPPGYRVEVVARDLTYPTSIAFDDRGGIYVAEAGYAYGDPIAPAQIVRIGEGGSRAVVASQLQGPITGIAASGRNAECLITCSCVAL